MGGSAKGGGSSSGGSSWVLPSLQPGWQPQQRQQQQQRPVGSDNDSGDLGPNGPQAAAAGGGAMSPESIAMMKEIAKGAALGAAFGPGGVAIGSSIMGWREKEKQNRLAEGAKHIPPTNEKKMYSGGDSGGAGSSIATSDDEEGYGGYGAGLGG